MSQPLPVTAFALLGLLTLDDASLTGYELKQRADVTMRFYWTSPAMSQIYSELARLRRLEYVDTDDHDLTTRYRANEAGREALRTWLAEQPVGFPVLKHAPALRLMIGRVSSAREMRAMLADYLAELAIARADLQSVRTELGAADGPGEVFRYPALVADWGLTFFDAEEASARRTLAALAADEALD